MILDFNSNQPSILDDGILVFGSAPASLASVPGQGSIVIKETSYGTGQAAVAINLTGTVDDEE